MYYVKKIFPDVEANYRSKWLGQQELDIYIPEQKIAIEYDGEYGHSKLVCQKRDEKKNRLCQESQTHPELALELQKKKEVRGTNV